ncbi:unnamed protein product [Strongylus vulgaris]|uniref:BPTI/Kunitz inhibitor domain-containing protein n=1 Tax=Strongylus vulgaris TaxID=40348 RepID=A0A3P7I7V3_STRVU|nr:unnamed protein product [Strongylus vulgaris]
MVCAQPIARGSCEDVLIRYAYDIDEGQCVEFTYGGCEGNSNNFKTLSQCQRVCESYLKGRVMMSDRINPLRRICFLGIDNGRCGKTMIRYGYDALAGACIRFVYNGCYGNDNNFKVCEVEGDFDSLLAHDQTHIISVTEPAVIATRKAFFRSSCCHPIDRGSCFANVTRFAYDKESQRCVAFIYGGCKGNRNNFRTHEECINACY